MSDRLKVSLVRALYWLGCRTLPLILRFSRDLEHAERLGVDRPARFERLMMCLFRYRDIDKRIAGVLTLYLRRFFVTPRSWPERIFLHHIARSDDDRYPHTHPFPFRTTLLNEEYLECIGVARFTEFGYVPADLRQAYAGDSFFRRAEHCHRLIVPKPMWTLVLVGQAEREWGFVTPEGEIPAEEHTAEEDKIRRAA